MQKKQTYNTQVRYYFYLVNKIFIKQLTPSTDDKLYSKFNLLLLGPYNWALIAFIIVMNHLVQKKMAKIKSKYLECKYKCK